MRTGGSSPLTRGKRQRHRGRNQGDGLIPAHAGKTRARARGFGRRWAHPRSRGENPKRSASKAGRCGSSPLTRGKHGADESLPEPVGLIPAHAGKTRRGHRVASQGRAHPRSRGENPPQHERCRTTLGSSPLTRGKLARGLAGGRGCRLIPAHAGKTSTRRAARSSSAAHPRSRGENRHNSKILPRRVGSSPLTRGKHFLTCAFIAQIGQILESLELCASSESYSSPDAYATDALQGRVRSIGLAPRSSRGAS